MKSYQTPEVWRLKLSSCIFSQALTLIPSRDLSVNEMKSTNQPCS